MCHLCGLRYSGFAMLGYGWLLWVVTLTSGCDCKQLVIAPSAEGEAMFTKRVTDGTKRLVVTQWPGGWGVCL